jgi:SAM-dependent methyltransferase
VHSSVMKFGEMIFDSDLISGKSVLEVGSRNVNGSLSAHIESLNPVSYVGVDMIEGEGVDLAIPVEELIATFGENSFDVVFSTEMLEHCEDWKEAINQMKAVTKIGGTLIITTRGPGFPHHEYPGDFWRFTVADMIYIFSDFIDVQVSDDPEAPGVFVKAMRPMGWIAKDFSDYEVMEMQEPLKVSFGALVNDPQRLDMVLRESEFPPDMKCHIIHNPDSATKGLNRLLDMIQGDGADVAVLCHQDMFFRAGWIDQVRAKLAELPDSWIVAGIIGKDMDGNICGKAHDMRMPLHFNTGDIHTFPVEASCFDECVIIVNMKKEFRFDEGLDGFHLYGTLCVLQAQEMGGTAWMIDAFAEHFCMRPFSWFPDEDFQRCFKWVYERFPYARRVDSTVLGVEREDNKATVEV